MSLTCPTCRRTYPDGTVRCPVDTTALLPDEAFANADPSLEPGTMVGEYRIERKLGEGIFGTVYAGMEPFLRKRVAVKLLHERMSAAPDVVSRFISEARAATRIGHRNIVEIFSFGVYNDHLHYFVMEYCDGMTLGQLLQIKKRLTPAEALPILRGIADGLDAAHQAGISHRNLKPDNIFLVRIKDNQYFPKLLDFGVARLAQDTLHQEVAEGIAISAARYMSPEQCRGKKADHRTDVYALGCVAHEMLTGKPVFEADSPVDLMEKHKLEKPPAMSTVNPTIPFELDEPILEMLAKRPLGRPNSAGQAINYLSDAVRSAAQMSKPPPTPPFGTPATVLAMAETVRATEMDAPPTVPNAPPRNGPTDPGRPLPPVEQIRVTPHDVLQTDEPLPATRKSLTDLDIFAQKPPDSGNTEVASNPPIQSQVPATLASAPLTTGAVIDHVPEVKVVGANEIRKPLVSLPLVQHAGSSRRNAVMAVLGLTVLLGIGAALGLRSQPTTSPTTPEASTSQTQTPPKPETITLKATVTPTDAHIIVDGRDLGTASAPIVLPREKKERAVRFERKGYESQTMWVTVDADKQLGPITLVALAAHPVASTSASSKKPAPATSGSSKSPNTKKKTTHKKLGVGTKK